MLDSELGNLGPARGDQVVFEVPVCMRPFFVQGPRYRVVYGGRGSVKSWTIARALVVLACTKKLRILCAREFQKSIRESVHYLLKSQIFRLGLEAEYIINDTEIVNRWTGSQFIFVGLHHNMSAKKSMEAIDICWIEEAETISQDSWDVLDPTIRSPGSEIWISFNPREELDPIFQMFALKEKRLPGAMVLQVGWKDNPWLPEVLRRQAEYMREHDPERYEHIWGGKTWFKNDAQVLYGKWCSKDFDVQLTGRANYSGPFLGVDFGFSQDPSCGVKSYVELLNSQDVGRTVEVEGADVQGPLRRNLYIAEEAFAMPGTPGAEITHLHGVLDTISEFRKYTSLADSARPETISHLVNVDGMILMRGCVKWPGCVEDGIAYLRGFERIYVHPSCTNVLEECRLWSYKRDPLTKKPLRLLKPGYDHGWDAIRYSHEDLVTRTPTIFDTL
jgi:phage terminase large subunit